MSDRLSPSIGPDGPTSPSGAPKIRRRNRIITSCLECRRRKLKCDRSHPCNHCTRAKRDCFFLAPSLDPNSKNKLNQFKESVETLEKDLGRQDDNGSFNGWNVSSAAGLYDSSRSTSAPGQSETRPALDVPADERYLEPSPLAVAEVVYDDDHDDLMDDLGIKFGKLRMIERIGGFIRPKFADELQVTMSMNPNLKAPAFAVDDRAAADASSPIAPSDDGSHSWLEPSAEYLAPGLGLTFPFSQSEDVSLLTFLPSKDFADKLLERYWISVDPLAKSVHRHTFNRQYAQFWSDVSTGFEPPSSLQALVFAMLFSAAVSLLDEQAQSSFGCERADMVRTFRMGCEFALSKSNLLRTTKTMTIQAFIMYLVPLCRAEVSRAHASLVSMAIRLAECAGFHRDGSIFGLNPIDTHVRRLLWYQLCSLDIRVCDAVGPRPSIIDDNFDVKLPLNVDDIELESMVAPTQDAARFTDMTLYRIRIESTGLSRVIWTERPRVEKGLNSLTALLKVIEAYKDRMAKIYIPLLDHRVPVQAFTALFIQFTIARAAVGVLHRYVVSTPQEAPARLKRIVWSNGARALETSVEWDTSPVFKPLYSWFLGTMQQWHVALLFVPLIITAKSPEPELERVWAALDYVFEFDPQLSRSEKMQRAFGISRKRLGELQDLRKTRMPTALEQRLGTSNRQSKAPDRRKSSSLHAPASQIRTPSTQDTASPENPYARAEASPSSFTGSVMGSQPRSQQQSTEYNNDSSPNLDPGYFQMPVEQPISDIHSGPIHDSVTSSQFPNVNWDDFESLLFNEQYFPTIEPHSMSASDNDFPASTTLPDPPWLKQPENGDHLSGSAQLLYQQQIQQQTQQQNHWTF